MDEKFFVTSENVEIIINKISKIFTEIFDERSSGRTQEHGVDMRGNIRVVVNGSIFFLSSITYFDG